MRHLTIIKITVLLAFAGLSLHLSAQSSCNCPRTAMLTEFTNPGNPDYEKQNKEWNDCMKGELGSRNYDEDDPKYQAAQAKCASKAPTKKWYCYPSLVSTYLGEKLTSNCFHMLSSQYFNPNENKAPDYIFKGSYEGEMEGGRIVEYAEDYKKPVVAKMSIQLYYNGTAPELVAEWASENTINEPHALFNKLNMPKDISPILEKFEKRPVTCEVKIPSVEELCENGTGEIELSGFKDQYGSSSKSFNRIVVSIYKGKILNGEKSDFGPDYKVFTVSGGTIKVKYQLPDDKGDGYEWLRVYSSCDILPPSKYPFSRTATDKMIAEENFPIFCDEIVGTISMSEKMEAGEKESLLAALTPGGEYNVAKNWRIEVTFKPAGSSSNYFYYDLEKAELLSFSDKIDQTMFDIVTETGETKGKVKESAEDKGRTLSASECDLELTINPVTGKYWIKGNIEVEGIEIKGKEEVNVKVKPVINENVNEDAEGTTGIDESVDISGSFTPAPDGSLPEQLLGKKDYMQDLNEEFREFMEALGGKQTIIMRWNLRKN